jgi:Glycosyl transferases group 1
MRILLWHLHGGWTDAFVRGRHDYFLPVSAGKGSWGIGRCGRPWPDNVKDVPLSELATLDVDFVLLQRPEELTMARILLGREPGRDLPAAYVEHNTPPHAGSGHLHPLAGQSTIPIVHVTHFNDLMWDNGKARHTVVEHGIPDPGLLYTGEHLRCGVVINEPVRRWRATGTDLLPAFAQESPVEVFGMAGDALFSCPGFSTARLSWAGDLPTGEMHARLATNRVYLHTARWTSLDLSLLEAMHLGMPVVALATTEAPSAVPPQAGVVSNNVAALTTAVRRFMRDPALARHCGKEARTAALERFGLQRFLNDWDELLDSWAK